MVATLFVATVSSAIALDPIIGPIGGLHVIDPILPPSLNCGVFGGCSVYVDSTPSDPAAVPDGTKEKPYTTITDAVNVVKGDTVHNTIVVAEGNYGVGETFPFAFSNFNNDQLGVANSVFIYGGYNSDFDDFDPEVHSTVINADSNNHVFFITNVGVVIKGFSFEGGGKIIDVKNTTAGISDVKIEANTFSHNDTFAAFSPDIITIDAGTNSVEIKNNIFKSNYTSSIANAIWTIGNAVKIHQNLFVDNKLYSVIGCEDGSTIYNNYILDNDVKTGVDLIGSCHFYNNTLAYNTIVNSTSTHAVVVLKGNGNVAHNNLITDNSGNESYRHVGGDNSVFTDNGLWNNVDDAIMLDLDNPACDPKYVGSSKVDPSNVKLGDDSTCIDAGINISSISVDYFDDGAVRGVDGNGDGTDGFDLGAFEHAVVLPPAAVLPAVTDFTVTPATFSPNGDGTDDVAAVSFKVDVASEVTVKVLDSANAVVRTLMDGVNQSAGAVVSTTWNGMPNASSTAVDNGTYTVKVEAKNTDGVGTATKNVVVANSAVGNPPVDDRCAGYTDVAKTSADCDAITYMQTVGAMTGNPDGTFDPSGVLQRDQIAKIVLETFNKFDNTKDYCNGSAPFSDVKASDWAYQYVCRGKDLGLITGYKAGADAGKYIPARSVNRVEFLALLLRNLSEAMPALSSTSYTDVLINQWFSGYAKYAYDHSLFVGSKLFPTNFTTRVEVARVVYKLHDQGKV